MRVKKSTLALTVVLAALLTLLAVYVTFTSLQKKEDKPFGAPYVLTDQNGQRLASEALHGKLQLIYFGYTFCPDVCPTSLFAMAEALDMLGEARKAIHPILITIDPKRDTPQVLKEYMTNFGDDFIGLTGSEEEIRAVLKSHHIYARRAEREDDDEDTYLMDHSSYIYLLDREGRFILVFPHGEKPDKIVSELKKHL